MVCGQTKPYCHDQGCSIPKNQAPLNLEGTEWLSKGRRVVFWGLRSGE